MKKILTLLTVLSLACAGESSAGHDTNRIKVYADLDRPVVHTTAPERVVVKVGLSADQLAPQERRVPLNLAIVIDKSGSMGGQNKITNARMAAIDLIDRLNENDIASLIVYDTSARVMVSAQRVTEKSVFIDTIQRITADGSTALHDGVAYGAAEVRRNASSEHLNRIILLSDGLANVGPQSTPQIAGLGVDLARDGISVTTVGVGLDYNEDLMGALASAGGGNIYFADNSDRIPEIFAQEVGEAMTMAAHDVRIKLECADGVVPVGMIGRQGAQNGNAMEVTINNLYGIKGKDALFEVQVPPGTADRVTEIARVTVEYFDPARQEKVTENKAVSVRYSADAGTVEQAVNKDIVKAAALTRTSELKQQAIQLADQGRYNEADAVLQQNAVHLEKVAQRCDNDSELLAEAKRGKESSWSDNMNKGLGRFFRKRMQAEAQSQIGQQYEPGYVDSSYRVK